MTQPDVPRCGWVQASPLEMACHDSEWGTTSHYNTPLFEISSWRPTHPGP